MPFNGGSQSIQRYFPTSQVRTFTGLVKVVSELFQLRNSDDFTMTVTFSAGASLFTWGENFTAQVTPSDGGSTVHVNATGKVGGQIQQAARIGKLVNQLFDELSAALRSETNDRT
jgi:hypothetical protein